MVNKIFTILLVIPAFASIMLFSTFMTPVSAGGPGPDFIGAPVTPFILNIDLSNAVQVALLDGESEIREGFRAPTQPGWENHLSERSPVRLHVDSRERLSSSGRVHGPTS